MGKGKGGTLVRVSAAGRREKEEKGALACGKRKLFVKKAKGKGKKQFNNTCAFSFFVVCLFVIFFLFGKKGGLKNGKSPHSTECWGSPHQRATSKTERRATKLMANEKESNTHTHIHKH